MSLDRRRSRSFSFSRARCPTRSRPFFSFSTLPTLRTRRTAAAATASCLPAAALSFDLALSPPSSPRLVRTLRRGATERPPDASTRRRLLTREMTGTLSRARKEAEQEKDMSSPPRERIPRRGGARRGNGEWHSCAFSLRTAVGDGRAGKTRFDEKTRRWQGGDGRSKGTRPRPKRPLGTESTG